MTVTQSSDRVVEAAYGDEDLDDAFASSPLDPQLRRAPGRPSGAPSAASLWIWLWFAAFLLTAPFYAALRATAWGPSLADWALPGALCLGLAVSLLAVGLDVLLRRRAPLRPSLGLAVALGALLAAALGGAWLTTLPGALVPHALDRVNGATERGLSLGALALGAAAGALATFGPLTLFIAARRAPTLSRGAFTLTIALVAYWAWPQGRLSGPSVALVALLLALAGVLLSGEALARRLGRWAQLGLETADSAPMARRAERQIVALSALLALIAFVPWPVLTQASDIRLWAPSPFDPPAGETAPTRADLTTVLAFGAPLSLQSPPPLRPDADAVLLGYRVSQAPASLLSAPPLAVTTLDTYADGAWSAAPTAGQTLFNSPSAPGQGSAGSNGPGAASSGAPCADGRTATANAEGQAAQQGAEPLTVCVTLLAPTRFAASSFNAVYLPTVAGLPAPAGAGAGSQAGGQPLAVALPGGASPSVTLYAPQPSSATPAPADASWSSWNVTAVQADPESLGGGWSYALSGATTGSLGAAPSGATPAVTTWAPAVHARLTAVPEGLRAPLRAALVELGVRPQAPPDEQARQALAGLRAWRLDPPTTNGPGGDDAIRALLATRHGTARVWVATFTLLLRALGLPARLVEGFAPPASALRINQPTLLRTRDTGVWLQVALGTGWQDIWPTASAAAIPPRQASGSGAATPGAQPASSPTATPTATPTGANAPPASATPAPSLGATIQRQAQSAVAAALNPLLIVIAALLGLLGLLALALLAIAVLSRVLDHRRRLDDLATREEIKRVLLGVGRLGRLAGALPDPTASELDAQGELNAVLPAEAQTALEQMNVPYRTLTYAAAPPAVLASLITFTRGDLFAAEAPVRGALFALLRRQCWRHPLHVAVNARRLALERALPPVAPGGNTQA